MQFTIFELFVNCFAKQQSILQLYNFKPNLFMMSVMSIRVDNEKKKLRKPIASLQGKSMSSIVEFLIDQYVEDFKAKPKLNDDLKAIMKVSEPSFEEWDNDKDEIYDELQTWDIVLVPFPFTNLETTKKRPALIISPNDYNKGPDLIILFITSNLQAYGRMGDTVIQHWKESGLPKPLMIRMKFATIERSMIIKKIGTLNNIDREGVRGTMLEFFNG